MKEKDRFPSNDLREMMNRLDYLKDRGIGLSTVSVMEFYRQLCGVLGLEAKGGKPGMFDAIQTQSFHLYKDKRQPLLLGQQLDKKVIDPELILAAVSGQNLMRPPRLLLPRACSNDALLSNRPRLFPTLWKLPRPYFCVPPSFSTFTTDLGKNRGVSSLF